MDGNMSNHVPTSNPTLHLYLPPITSLQEALIDQVKARLSSNPLFEKHRKWADDRNIYRFCSSRKFDLEQTVEIMNSALEWRDKRRPDELCKDQAGFEFLSREGETGKIYIPGLDKVPAETSLMLRPLSC